MKNEIKAMRARAGLSQAELAKAMDVSRQTINAIETERYTPSLPLALALARYFDTTVEEIFDDGECLSPNGSCRSSALALGGVCAAALWAGGNRGRASLRSASSRGLGLVFALGGRSELIRGLRGDGKDEYWARARPARDGAVGDGRDHGRDRHVSVGVGARSRRVAVRAARRSRRARLHRRRRPAALAGLKAHGTGVVADA